MSETNDRKRLMELLRRESVRFGDFVLASGQKSNVYIDARLTTCRAEAMPLIGNAFLDKMDECGWRPEAVGGLTMGADPVAMAIARESLERRRRDRHDPRLSVLRRLLLTTRIEVKPDQRFRAGEVQIR